MFEKSLKIALRNSENSPCFMLIHFRSSVTTKVGLFCAGVKNMLPPIVFPLDKLAKSLPEWLRASTFPSQIIAYSSLLSVTIFNCWFHAKKLYVFDQHGTP